jgi:predicted AAA+ superfamily ATPase
MRIFPMGFAEYLIASGVEQFDSYVTESKAKIRALFADFIIFGGFPEASLKKDPYLLKAYFDSIIYRDVIPRFNIQNAAGLEALSRYLVSNPGKPTSYNKLIPVTNVKHEDTVKSYLGFLEKAYLFTIVPRFDFSLKKQAGNLKKIYPADTSFSRFSGSLFSEERGRMLETIVCNELMRRNFDVFYWKNERGKEVDFVVCQGLKPLCLIQVCERIDSEKVMKRETDPLLLAGEELKVNELILLADVIPDMKPPDGIKLISAIEWLTR